MSDLAQLKYCNKTPLTYFHCTANRNDYLKVLQLSATIGILDVVLITAEKLMLDTFITSRVRRKIVVVYAKYPDFKTHVRGLAKLIKEDAGNIQRELKKLERVGFLLSEKQGNTKVYYTNKNFIIFKDLQSIVLKSQRAAQKRQRT